MANSNRDSFLQGLAKKYGRPLQTTPEPMPTWHIDTPKTRLTQLNKTELGKEFIAFSRKLGIKVAITTEVELSQTVLRVCQEYQGGPIILNDDQRLHQAGITSLLQETYGEEVSVWNPELGRTNIEKAAAANVGIVYGEWGLTESGGHVLEQNSNNGRSVSLLPTYSIVVLRASKILPTMNQYAQMAASRAQNGERMPSVINLISGPSSTADIELVRVVGVHGPVGLAYVVINDDNSLEMEELSA